MKVYVYKEFNDSYAYGEELIKVYAKKEDAVKTLKKAVEDRFDNDFTFDEILANNDGFDGFIWSPEDEQVSEDYVSLSDGDGVGIFFIVEEQEVL